MGFRTNNYLECMSPMSRGPPMGVVENLISELSTARGDRRVRIFVILKMSCLLSQLTLSVTLFGAVACGCARARRC